MISEGFGKSRKSRGILHLYNSPINKVTYILYTILSAFLCVDKK